MNGILLFPWVFIFHALMFGIMGLWFIMVFVHELCKR